MFASPEALMLSWPAARPPTTGGLKRRGTWLEFLRSPIGLTVYRVSRSLYVGRA